MIGLPGRPKLLATIFRLVRRTLRPQFLLRTTATPILSCTAVHILEISHDSVWVILDLVAFHDIHTEYTENF